MFGTHVLQIIPGLMHTLILPVSTYRGERLCPRKWLTTLDSCLALLTLFSFWCNFRQELCCWRYCQSCRSSSLAAQQLSGMTWPPHRNRANICTTAKYCPWSAWQGRVPFASNDPLPVWQKHQLHNMHQRLPQATHEKNYGLVCFSWLRHPGKELQRLSFHLHSPGRASPQCRQWLSSSKQHGPSTHTAELTP